MDGVRLSKSVHIILTLIFSCFAAHFFYFYLMAFASIYCNLGLAYVTAFLCSNANTSRMIFNGVFISLQLLVSGYFILILTIDSISWGRFICPMRYF